MASNIGKKKGERPPRVASATADRGMTGETAAAVGTPPITKGMRAGQYVRLTLTVREDQLDRIRKELPDRWAAELKEMTGWPASVSVLEIGRWLLDKGLEAFDAGERPDVPAIKPRAGE